MSPSALRSSLLGRVVSQLGTRKRVFLPVWAAVSFAIAYTLYSSDFALSTPWNPWNPWKNDHVSTELVFVTTESRELYIPEDPSVPLPFWTLAALQNHLYAKAFGGHFIYYTFDGPLEEDGTRPIPSCFKHFGRLDGYCHHPVYGWRTAHFCKMPLVWNLLRTEPTIKNLIFIDSDALFRSPNISVYRHLDQLTPERYFGILTNRPYDVGPNSGYWFLRRDVNEIANGSPSVEDYLIDWWNEDCMDTYVHYYEQGTLRKLMGGDYPGGELNSTTQDRDTMDRVVFLDEWAFALKSEDQLLLHMNHNVPDRDIKLAGAWSSTEYPLNDRAKLRTLMEDIDVRQMDPAEIIKRMPLPK